MSERKLIIAGNWKMNKTPAESKQLATEIAAALDGFTAADLVLCPTYTGLAGVADIIGGKDNIALGAQNLHQEASGAFTGEISAAMLTDLGCQYVIIGHSERRQYFGETDELIKTKTKVALDSGLLPIVCIGETLEEREADRWKAVLETQIKGGLSGFSADEFAKVVIAYEPVWAIGTGVTATPEQAQETQAFVRSVVADIYGADQAAKTRIQYGGSVKPGNAKELLGQPDIDGALVGGASLEAESFAGIATAATA